MAPETISLQVEEAGGRLDVYLAGQMLSRGWWKKGGYW